MVHRLASAPVECGDGNSAGDGHPVGLRISIPRVRHRVLLRLRAFDDAGDLTLVHSRRGVESLPRLPSPGDKAGHVETLTYTDAVQISLLAMIVSMVLGGLYSLIEFPSVRLGLLAEVPLVLLVIYPAIAEAAVYVRYRGFRLLVERG